MRTLDDLRGAFALLEQQADEYTASRTAEFASGSADEIPMVEHPTRHARRRPVLWLTAAAVAVGLTVGGLALFGGGGGRTPAGDPNMHHDVDQLIPLRAELLTVPAAVDPSAGVKIVGVEASAMVTNVRMANSSHNYELTIDRATKPDDYALLPPPKNALPVKIAGVSGYFWSASMAGPNVVAYYRMTAVQWHMPDGTTVNLSADSSATEANVLKVARAIRFEKTTEIRSALEVPVAITGMHLTRVIETYSDVQPGADGLGNPPFNVSSATWTSSAVYEPPSGGDGVAIEVSTTPSITAKSEASRRVTVLGSQTAYWSSSVGALTMDLGLGTYLNVSDLRWGAKPAISLDDLVAIAAKEKVVADPQQRSNWLDARSVLTLGGN